MDRRDYYAQFSDYPDGTTFNEGRMILSVPIYNCEDGTEEVYEFPCTFEVCGTCDGKGKHVNPSIDAHGITQDEWENDWSYEDRENYFSGMYDVQCNECKGRRVVPEINHDILSEDQKKARSLLREWQEDEEDYRRICEAERRMGA